MERPLDIEVLAEALVVHVSSIASPDHPVFVLWLQLPDVFLVDVVDLLLGEDAVPEEEVVDPVVVAAEVLLHEDLVDGVGADLHSPDVLAVLHEEVLRQLGSWSDELVD